MRVKLSECDDRFRKIHLFGDRQKALPLEFGNARPIRRKGEGVRVTPHATPEHDTWFA